jgi:cell division protein FtsA
VDVVRNPIHATGVGLLLYALEQRETQALPRRGLGNFNGIWAKVKTWFQGGV